MTSWGVSGGDPVPPGPPDLVARLDEVRSGEPCGPPDPGLFAPLAGRWLVAFAGPPDGRLDEAAEASLGRLGRLRWVYRQLHLAEVDADDGSALAGVPGVVGVTPAWRTVGATRGVVVGLNALCAVAAQQATDPGAYYRHPPGIGYPVVRADGTRALLDLDPTLELPTPPALIPVVNLSLGTTTVGFPTAMNDLVNLATGAASGQVLVVVAAGNCGRRPGDSLSAWARPPWVLSVGAADDEAGTTLAGYSSRGGPGPDVVALGRSALDPRRRGTSYAAPRVTFLARLVVAAFCELGSELRVAQGHPRTGVPAVGAAILDDFGDEIWWEPESATAIQALPLLGVRRDVVADLVAALAAAGGADLVVRATPSLVREVLVSAARPVPGATTAEAGAGFVDLDLVVDRLAALTGADLWGWFGGPDVPPVGALADLRPFDGAGLRALAPVVAITGPTVKVDHRTGCWAALPPPDDRARASHPRGWPLDLAEVRVGPRAETPSGAPAEPGRPP